MNNLQKNAMMNKEFLPDYVIFTKIDKYFAFL